MADNVFRMWENIGRMTATMRTNREIRESERLIMATTEKGDTIPCPPPTEAELNSDGMTYDNWLKRVNAILDEETGMTLDDFADRNTWDAWNAGEDPDEYADTVLEEEGFED